MFTNYMFARYTDGSQKVISGDNNYYGQGPKFKGAVKVSQEFAL